MDIETFRRIFFARASGADIKIPKAVEAAFAGVDDEISAAIATYRSQRTRKLETDLFEQRARLAAAEKKLAVKITKGQRGRPDCHEQNRCGNARARRHSPAEPAGA
nr:hypothetical protein [Burkholderia latens]